MCACVYMFIMTAVPRINQGQGNELRQFPATHSDNDCCVVLCCCAATLQVCIGSACHATNAFFSTYTSYTLTLAHMRLMTWQCPLPMACCRNTGICIHLVLLAQCLSAFEHRCCCTLVYCLILVLLQQCTAGVATGPLLGLRQL